VTGPAVDLFPATGTTVPVIFTSTAAGGRSTSGRPELVELRKAFDFSGPTRHKRMQMAPPAEESLSGIHLSKHRHERASENAKT
jgi:hypothetical protein